MYCGLVCFTLKARSVSCNIQSDGKVEDCKENVHYCPVELHIQQGTEDGGLGGPEITSYLKVTYR
jgi:hypothetical protein